MSLPRLYRPRNWAAFLFVLCLALSLLFCFVLAPRLMDSTSGLDPDGYGSAGCVLYETGQFDSIEKAPLYPAFIALVSLLTGGYRIWTVQAAQCFLAAFTCVLLYVIFRRTLREPVARWAGLACALYPMLIWYTPRLWTEIFLMFVLAGFALALVNLLQNPTAPRALLCGAMAGIVALSKGIALIFILLTPLVLLLRFRAQAWRWIPLLLLAAAALIAPWTWRNWTLTGALLPVHASGGYNFYLGNGFARNWLQAPFSYVDLKTMTMQDAQNLYDSLSISIPTDPLTRDRVLLRAALVDMHTHPSLVLQKLAVQSLTLWYLAADTPKSILTGILQIPVVLVALLGVARAVHRRSWALALLVPIIGVVGVSMAVFAFARLSATIMPYLIGLAVYGLGPVIEQLRRST
jgi:4-amino-4-deoxy-L-arabinose transferase-like glycosyltransferase